MDATDCIFRLSQAFGFFPFTVGKSKGRKVFRESGKHLAYTVLVTVLYVSTGVSFGFGEIEPSLKMAPHKSSQLVLLVSNMAVSLSGIMIFYSVLTKRKQFCHWLNKVQEVFSCLASHKLRKVGVIYCTTFVAVVAVLVSTILLEMHSFDTMYKDVLNATSRPTLSTFIFSYYFLTFEIKMFVLLLSTFVNLIGYYYEYTSEVLIRGTDSWDKKSSLRFLRDFRSKDLDIKDFLEFLNSFFGSVLSLHLISGIFSFLFTVSMVSKGTETPPLLQMFWTLYVVWDTFALATWCQYAENKADRTVHCLHDVFIRCDDREVKKEIDIISLQLQHRRLEFVTLECQRLNLSMIYWMIGLLASYAVIMAQFHINPNKGNNSNAANCSCQ